MTFIEKTPNEELYQAAIVAHFDDHITDQEFQCFREAYGPDWSKLFKSVRVEQKPRWIRWWYRLW